MPMLLGIIAIPFLLNRIGVERLGVLTLIWSLIGYFSIFDFGLGRALTQKIASIRGGDPGNIIKAAQSGIGLMLLTGLLGATATFLLFTFADVSWLGVSAQLTNETKTAIYLAALGIPAATITSGLKGILEGYENFQTANVLRLVLGASNFLAPMAAVKYYGPDLSIIVAGLVASRIVVMALHIPPVVRKLRLHTASKLPTKQNTGLQLFRFGAWMTLSNLISPLMVISDRFVISHVSGGSVVAYYTIPNDFLLRTLVIPAAITTTIFPIFSLLMVCDIEKAKKIYKKSLYTIFGVMAFFVFFTVLFGHWGLSRWLGPEFADKSYLVAIILALGVMLNGMAQVPHSALQGGGNVRITSIIHACEFFVYTPILLTFVYLYGITGAAIAWTARAAADFLLLSWHAKKAMEASSV